LLLLAMMIAAKVSAAEPRPGSILPPDWNAKAAADQVLAGLVKVTAPEIKGAHDSEFALLGDRAYVVAEVNEVKAGEAPSWPYIYASLSVVNLHTLAVERIVPLARGGESFENETLPPGACFVPRALALDDRTVRCYFASEDPGHRQSQIWYRDFDSGRQAFAERIERMKLKTSAGLFDLQPAPFHADAAAQGFARPAVDYGLYLIDPFKVIDGRMYVAVNNYAGGQNALTTINDRRDTLEILGHFNAPADVKLTESAVNRLPDGSWLAICRNEGGDRNYRFTTSADGTTWTPGEQRACVPSGDSSKPTLDKFGGVYYLGWQSSERINNVSRSVFQIDVSRDGRHWERKYRFETEKSFQYPAFREHQGQVWLVATQGDSDPSRKERIMFGRLESVR
jgi:hypothetical protein